MKLASISGKVGLSSKEHMDMFRFYEDLHQLVLATSILHNDQD